MVVYNLPEFRPPKLEKLKLKISNLWKEKLLVPLALAIIVSSIFGFIAGSISSSYFYVGIVDYLDRLNPSIAPKIVDKDLYIPQTSQEQAIIKVVKEVSPSVVSIIVTKDLPILEEYYYSPFEEFFEDPFFEFNVPEYRQEGVEKKEIGGGTGFIISEDGMVLTNKHVVLDEEADYTILTSEGEKFSAKILAKDPLQDIAILKINPEDNGSLKIFPKVKLGDSDKIQIGQTAIVIGYVLGRYQNTVSVGIISGLGRTITASGGGFYETLEDIIQTDAAINKGNSGGTLLNLRGEVIGINTAIDVEGQNIGFAIPINKAKRDIEQVKKDGKIVYPFLGVRYILITEEIQRENNLTVNQGAWIVSDPGEPAVIQGSAAQEAGLKEGDIILEFNGEKITLENSLAKIITKYNPGDEISLKVLSGEKERIINKVILGERSK